MSIKMRNQLIYREQADLALQITDDPQEWYKIIKNREDATAIDHGVTHITKAVIPYMLEGKLKIVIYDLNYQVRITNFFLEER